MKASSLMPADAADLLRAGPQRRGDVRPILAGLVRMELLRPATGGSACEWKGRANYFDVRSGDEVIEHAAWSYEQPLAAFTEITGHNSFYPGRVDCYVHGERVRPQAGGFYGGWITNEIVGPFKGDPGTGG